MIVYLPLRTDFSFNIATLNIGPRKMADAFSSIPVIDFARLQDESTKEETLEQLRDAIFRVGFLYLTNHGLEVSYQITRLCPA